MSKIIKLEIPVSEEYATLWTTAKGYEKEVNELNQETGETTKAANPESEDDFFKRMLKKDLMEIAIVPINQLLTNNIALQTADTINYIKQAVSNNLVLDIESQTD